MSAPRPPEAETVIATLRTAAEWMERDTDRAMMLEAAERAELDWDGACCPVCEEVTCDDGCPLNRVRTAIRQGRGDRP